MNYNFELSVIIFYKIGDEGKQIDCAIFAVAAGVEVYEETMRYCFIFLV